MKRSRLVIAALVLVAGIMLLHAVNRPPMVLPYRALAEFPASLGSYKGVNQPLSRRILRVAGVHDYVSRLYRDPAGRTVFLYIGYYPSQRTGDAIHSPKNCLPGSGWAPVQAGTLPIHLGRKRIVVNDYIVEKGLDRAVVLYWYQSRGRAIASEYWARTWLLLGALTQDRTDGALVRLWTPIGAHPRHAQRRAVAFVHLLAPHLAAYIPN
ncbi:MAG: exosortase C-terminal domain/associated protein EpsI [Terriglobales bacterium]